MEEIFTLSDYSKVYWERQWTEHLTTVQYARSTGTHRSYENTEEGTSNSYWNGQGGKTLSLVIKDEQTVEGPAHAKMEKGEMTWHCHNLGGSQELMLSEKKPISTGQMLYGIPFIKTFSE